jgi:hypothetical protein
MRARVSAAMTVVALGLATAVLGAAPPAHAGDAAIVIDPPDNPVAGAVRLTGTAGAGTGQVTSVLYVVDATNSTAAPTGSDCSGDGSVGPADDLNADGSVGDVLDCELSGVLALNSSLASASDVQAGVEAFSNQAAIADLNPDPSTAYAFVPPGYTGGDPSSRVDTVARSVDRGQIGLYTATPLGGSGAGTAFNNAVHVALDTLASAPAGPKWVMFLSDGQSAIDDALLQELSTSGVELRSFGIGAQATCAHSGSLYKLAAATGESCTQVTSPAALAAGLTGAHPDAVQSVSVSIKDVSLAADLNPVGGWSVTFQLGQGTYTATARSVLVSGATVTARRTFTVGPGAGGPTAGTVRPGAGSLLATVVKVGRPGPTRDVLPSKVTGRVGVPQSGVSTTRKLAGAQVLLQVRAAAGDDWVTVDRDRVDKAGRFTLSWHPKAHNSLLRVALEPHKKYAGSAATVPAAPISSCKVKKAGSGWSVSCHTTAQAGSQVRLLKGGAVVDTARVRADGFHLHGSGAVAAHTVDLAANGHRHIRLEL